MWTHSNSLLRCFSVLAVAAALGGCVANKAGNLSISKEVADQSTYYVERQPKDEHNLAATIAQRMQARGLKATAEQAGAARPQCDYIVSYTDKWMWDMRMYLYDLRIDLRDANDQSVVGFGQSMQSSLEAMGKSYEDIIDIALDELFSPGKQP